MTAGGMGSGGLAFAGEPWFAYGSLRLEDLVAMGLLNAESLPLEERILARLRQFPPERQAEVLDFVEFLDQRRQATAELRPIGLGAGDFEVPDDFDAPLPDEMLRLFES